MRSSFESKRLSGVSFVVVAGCLLKHEPVNPFRQKERCRDTSRTKHCVTVSWRSCTIYVAHCKSCILNSTSDHQSSTCMQRRRTSVGLSWGGSIVPSTSFTPPSWRLFGWNIQVSSGLMSEKYTRIFGVGRITRSFLVIEDRTLDDR